MAFQPSLFAPRYPTFALLGNSHMASFALDTNLSSTGNSTASYYPSSPWRYFGYSNQITHAMIRLGFRIKPVACFGKGGDTVGGSSYPTEGYVARLPLIGALSPLPGYCFVEAGGSNDLDQGIANSVILAALNKCITYLLRLNIVPILIEMMPWSPTSVTATANLRARLIWAIRDMCRTLPVIYVPLSDMGMKSQGAGASNVSNLSLSAWTSDGTHLSHYGASQHGDWIARCLDPYLPYYDDCQFTDYDPATVLGQGVFHSGLTAGIGGTFGSGCTGRVATGITIACSPGTAICRVQPRRGTAERQWQEVSITSPGTKVTMTFSTTTGIISPGQSTVTSLQFQADPDWINVTRFNLVQQYNSSNGWSTGCGELANESTMLTPPVSPRGMPMVLRTPAGIVPNGGTALNPVVNFYGDGGTIRVSRVVARIES